MINTYSKFYYGYTITGSNKYLDFNEGSGELTATLSEGTYTLTDLCLEIETQMTDVSLVNSYSVTINRTTRVITISASNAFTILGSTGSNASFSPLSVMGFTATDTSSAVTHAGNSAAGSVYSPQFKLQDYVSHEDSRESRFATVSKAASGKVQMVSFGTDRMFEFSIKFATNNPQPSTGPIVSSTTGVTDLRLFMQYLIDKNYVEFMPDKDTPGTYYRVVLEKSPGGSDGTGYKLQEQFARGLVGFWETGILTFRIIED